MPYKEKRPQIGLKLMPSEYAVLQAEAARAGVSVNTYARHLITGRQPQPLAAEAADVRAHYQQREAVHQELLDEYSAAAYQARALSQQVKFFREQFAFIKWSLTRNQFEHIAYALQQALDEPVLLVTLPGEEKPSLDADSLTHAPVVPPNTTKKR